MTVMTTMPPRLGEAFERVQSDIDSAFDAFLPVPDDSRARLVEAMRYAAIGGGKRLRPLLVTATASLFKVPRATALRAGIAVEDSMKAIGQLILSIGEVESFSLS